MSHYWEIYKPKLLFNVSECSIISKAKEKRDKKESNVHSSLDICRISNSPYEQDEPCDIVIDYEHEWPVEGNSRGDREVQLGVRSPPIL